jgi:hypothetical protein
MNEFTFAKQPGKFLSIIIVGIMVIILAILMSIAFEFGIVGNLVMSWILTTTYAIFALLLIEPIINIHPVRVIEKPVIQEVIKFIEKPIFHEVQVPVDNRVIEVVEKPVIKEVFIEVPVEKRVTRYIERKHKRLNIPKFEFIGSTQTETFHKRTCKFSKMLKNKYKLHSNTKAFFKRKHYHACEACINKK